MTSLFSAKNKLYLYIFLFCVVTFSTIVFLDQDTFLFLVQEDGPFESAGALCFLGSAVLYFMLYWNEKRFADSTDRQFFSSKSKRIWFLLLGLLFIVLMGEEISWGQRIFGWAGWADNVQDETTVHNMPLFNQHLSKPGAEVEIEKEGLAALFTAKKIFVYIFLSFSFLLPLGVRFAPFIKHAAKRFYLPVPAIELGILFILNIILFKAFKPWRDIYDGAGRGLSEIEEFNFAFILLMVPFVWLLNRKGNLKLNYPK
jgi:hypothetical protein